MRTRVWLAAAVVAVALALVGIFAVPTGARASVTGTTVYPTSIRHVAVIVLENAEASSALTQPFEKYLAVHYTDFAKDYGVCHPSEPNYLALTSGGTWGRCGTDAYTVVSETNIGSDALAHNVTWKAYEQSMPHACDTTDSYPYAVKHNPFVFYSDIVRNPAVCDAHDVPMAQWKTDVTNHTLPSYIFITPNLKNDGHDTGVAYADKWLRSFLNPYLNATEFANTVWFVTYDEGSTNYGYNLLAGGHVYWIAAGPLADQLIVPVDTSHYTLLTTCEWLLGLPSLGHKDLWTMYAPQGSTLV